MPNTAQLKEVNFHDFCERCEFRDSIETLDPCDTCLETGVRDGTEKPLKFVEKEGKNGNNLGNV